MNHKLQFPGVVLAALFAVWVPSGCCSQAAQDQVETNVAVHEGYDRVVKDALTTISTDEWDQTPLTVQVTFKQLYLTLYTNRYAWNALNYALNDGPSPVGENWDPPELFGEQLTITTSGQ